MVHNITNSTPVNFLQMRESYLLESWLGRTRDTEMKWQKLKILTFGMLTQYFTETHDSESRKFTYIYHHVNEDDIAKIKKIVFNFSNHNINIRGSIVHF